MTVVTIKDDPHQHSRAEFVFADSHDPCVKPYDEDFLKSLVWGQGS